MIRDSVTSKRRSSIL